MKYFLCDIGHVLVDFDFRDFLDAIARDSGQPCGPLTGRDLQMHDAVETGEISDAEWVTYLNRTKGLSWTLDDLIALWQKMFTVQQTGRRLFGELLNAGIRVYTISNIAHHHMLAIENNWNNFFEGISGHFLSYRIGTRKPDPTIFRHVLDRLGVTGWNCFFIDDRPENIETARAVGIEAHQFLPENYSAIREAAVNFFEIS